MEMEGEDGSKIVLKFGGLKTVFGRGSGFNTNDRTVSRRHVLFKLINPVDKSETQTGPKVSFEVLGKNPIWVRSRRDGEIKVFRKFDKGEAETRDCICVSGQSPVWFDLKRIEFEDGQKRVLEDEVGLAENLEINGGLGCIDVSDIDPVKEFGFLVIGHEFDHYPKKMIRDMKNWDWFLEERRKDSDEDDEVLEERRKRRKRGMSRKRGKGEGGDDDDWTGESEDDKELIGKLRKVQRPNYSTRSKDCDKPQTDARKSKALSQKKTVTAKEVDSENEDEDTLGGFIVDDDDVELENESDETQEEEEDYDDDDDI